MMFVLNQLKMSDEKLIGVDPASSNGDCSAYVYGKTDKDGSVEITRIETILPLSDIVHELPLSAIEKELYEVLGRKEFNCLHCMRTIEKYDRRTICKTCGGHVDAIYHEPTLNDVLQHVYSRGVICGIHLGLGEIEIKHDLIYDLTKSFDNQSEETKRKLHDLICKK